MSNDRIGSRTRFDATTLPALIVQLNAAFSTLLSGATQNQGLRLDKRTAVPTAAPQDQGSPNLVLVTAAGVDSVYFWNGSAWIELGSSSGGAILSVHFVVPDTANHNISATPAALNEFGGGSRHRTKADLTNFTECNLYCRVATGGPNAEVRVQYSTDESTWNYLDGSAGPAVNVDVAGTKESDWVSLTAGAKANVFLRPVSINGDGVTDTGIGHMRVDFR